MKGRVCFTFATPDFTGACKMGYFFARSFIESGYDVVAVCGPRPMSTEPSVIDHLEHIGVPVRHVGGFENHLNFSLIRDISRFLRKEKINLVVSMVQTEIKIAGPATRVAGIPFIYSAQNATHFGGKPKARKLKSRLFGSILKHCASLSVCTSLVVKDEIISDFGVHPDKTALLPNGIDVSTFPSYSNDDIRETRQSLGVGPNDILFTNVGRLDEQKGQIHLLHAFAQANFAKHVKLLIVGGTSYGSQSGQAQSRAYADGLYRFAAEAGLTDQVIFSGWRNDIPRLLWSSDVYVHSSVREGPPLPLAMLEGMAAGLPIIGTDCSGYPEGFHDGIHGTIVPKGESTPLCSAMMSLARMDRLLREKMGESSRQLVETQFDVKALGARFVTIVETNLGPIRNNAAPVRDRFYT